MTAQELQDRLDDPKCRTGALGALRRELSELPSDEVFYLLFPLAINYTGWRDELAGALLLELEPRCPLSCEEALRLVGKSNLQVSSKQVPFYFVTQFGKARLAEAVKAIAREFAGEARALVTTISYWSQFPCIHVIEGYASARYEYLYGQRWTLNREAR